MSSNDDDAGRRTINGREEKGGAHLLGLKGGIQCEHCEQVLGGMVGGKVTNTTIMSALYLIYKSPTNMRSACFFFESRPCRISLVTCAT